MARDYLQGSGQYEVVEGVLSPVHESYKKKVHHEREGGREGGMEGGREGNGEQCHVLLSLWFINAVEDVDYLLRCIVWKLVVAMTAVDCGVLNGSDMALVYKVVPL